MKSYRKGKFWAFFRKCLWKHLKTKEVFFNASALSFTLSSCAIPFVLILISFASYLLSPVELSGYLTSSMKEFFPSLFHEDFPISNKEIRVTVTSFLEPLLYSSRIIGWVALTVLIFAVQGFFYTVRHVLDKVFGYKAKENHLKVVVEHFFVLGTVGVIFMCFSMLISVISFFPIRVFSIPFFDIKIQLDWSLELIKYIVSFLFMYVLIYILFRVLSRRRMMKKTAYISTLSFVILFETAKYLFTIIIEQILFAYHYIYQGYTFIIF